MRVFRPRRMLQAFLCINLLIFTATAFANDYYVSASGSNSNDGSQARPWATIQKCADSAALGGNGAVCHVADGSYPAAVHVTRGGSSPSAKLVLQCDSGARSATEAIGACKFTNSGGFLIEANNVDVIGFDIGGNASMGVGIDTVSNGGSTGNNVHLIANYVHDLGGSISNSAGVPGCPENGAIHGQSGISGAQVLGNIVARFGGNLSFSSSPACNTAQGIYYDSANGVIVQNNVVVKVPSGGITIRFGCSNVITNNIMIGGSAGLILSSLNNGSCASAAGGLSTISNNYFGAHSSAHIFWVSGSAHCTASTPNLFANNVTDGIGPDRSHSFSCDSFSPATMAHVPGTSLFNNYQTAPSGPGLGSADYRLKAGSSGIGTGSTTCVSGGVSPCTPAIDLEGVARVNPISLGVYEPIQSSSLPGAPTGLTATVQ